MYLSAIRGINVLNPMSHGWHGNEWLTLVCLLAVSYSLHGLAICVYVYPQFLVICLETAKWNKIYSHFLTQMVSKEHMYVDEKF